MDTPVSEASGQVASVVGREFFFSMPENVDHSEMKNDSRHERFEKGLCCDAFANRRRHGSTSPRLVSCRHFEHR